MVFYRLSLNMPGYLFIFGKRFLLTECGRNSLNLQKSYSCTFLIFKLNVLVQIYVFLLMVYVI